MQSSRSGTSAFSARVHGPTETNVCTYYDVFPLDESQTEPIPIGRAISDVEVFAVTDDGAIAGTGEVGEPYVPGNTVMQGYWGDSEKTEGCSSPTLTGKLFATPCTRPATWSSGTRPLSKLRRQRRPARKAVGVSTPLHANQLPMPPQQRLGRDEEALAASPWQFSGRGGKKWPVGTLKAERLALWPKNTQFVTEHDDL